MKGANINLIFLSQIYKMSINIFTFTNSDEKHELVVNVDKFGRQEASFYYVDLLTNKQYYNVCGFDSYVFKDVPKRFIKDALEQLVGTGMYSVKIRNETECICVFEFPYFGRNAMIAVEMSTKHFEEKKAETNIQELQNNIQELQSNFDNMYVANTYDITAIINCGIPDFYRKYHEFLMKHCELYRAEYEPTNYGSHEAFIKRRLLDHPLFTYGDSDRCRAIKVYNCERKICGKSPCICIPDGFYCDANHSNNYCVHASSSADPHLLGATKDCNFTGNFYPYYNSLLLTFLSVQGFNVWFGSKCNIVFTKTHHRLCYSGISMQGFNLSEFKTLSVPLHNYIVRVILNSKN